MTTKNNFDVLLFDLGGVLIDFAGFDEMTRLLPGAPDRIEIRNRWIESETVQRFERGNITPLQFALGIIRELKIDLSPDDFIAAFVDWVRGPYAGARALLGRLQSTHRVACLSNSNELHTPLHRQSIDPLMESYYFSNEIGHVKPHREIFDHVIFELNTPPGRIAFFDDTEVNVEAGKKAGLDAYLVDGFDALLEQLQILGLSEYPGS